ncbi:hypothetical protein BC937DRAFT_90339 [Endogone sp. FLAS-F59071]|nr:hypothetical protein BC937DRAFT_90339 [Endogone sp. FLAS-F59071]|eukprot:RUS23220.1 hypothetical protein BC937DRAFT_90339 [Endogone sp. FLAS-F59071]
MCYLRGLVYSKQNNIERAKGCYKEALLLDIKCFAVRFNERGMGLVVAYNLWNGGNALPVVRLFGIPDCITTMDHRGFAFEALVGNHMMTNGEEWLFITSLKFEEQCPEDSEFIRSLYITKLKKYAHTEEIEAAQTRLETKYNLKENPDVLFGRAEAAFTQCRFQECYDVTSNILKIDQYNPLCLPTHLACLYELGLKNELFYLSHELVDRYPEMAVTWFGVGVYYYLIGKNAEARRYFRFELF